MAVTVSDVRHTIIILIISSSAILLLRYIRGLPLACSDHEEPLDGVGGVRVHNVALCRQIRHKQWHTGYQHLTRQLTMKAT